jgi:hypothetical protein
MTLELCAANCVGFTYFGTEYGRECKLTTSMYESKLTIKVIAATASLPEQFPLRLLIALSLVLQTGQNFAVLVIVSQSMF